MLATCTASTSTVLLRVLTDGARRRGLSARAVQRATGVSLESLYDTARVSTPLARTLTQTVSALVDDGALGVHCAEEASVGAFGVLEKLLQNSATFGEGMCRVARRFAVLFGSSSLHVQYRGPRVALLCQARDLVPVAEDLLVASLALRARQYLGEEIRPLYVRVTYARPRDSTEHERVVNSPLYFGGKLTELVFEREAFELELPGANPVLADELERMIDRRAAPWTRPPRRHATPRSRDSFLQEVGLALSVCLEHGGTQLQDVAAAMGTSPRSLQRHLRAAGSCFHHLVSQQRLRFLAQHAGQLSKAGAARRLGYADRRSLRRAEAAWSPQLSILHDLEHRDPIASAE